MEPRAATPTRRLETLKLLSAAGIPTTVMVAPIIPALNEPEIERILEAATAAGVSEAGYVLLRLPLEVRDIFVEFLEREYPDRAKHVMSVIRSMRGGKDYDSSWGQRMRGDGPFAWQIGRRFEIAARRLGLNTQRVRLRTDLFTPPGSGAQLDLFGNKQAA
jgi:DNA repair photolyase